ncbi:methyltransferas-like protein [Pleomassaria siparia CBS 279.74]|uniref:carnosine N-methyltransferase n=1 Tax=Pleomassaria siparia CBS 279.74 TaxID=1314801 RepID=A0A6G1KR49_9PLEO|nr:methyltransferas-like protein [Pleomassaria siparia CBS 279.74]
MVTSEWTGPFDPSSDPEELTHLLSVLSSFLSYRRHAHYNGTHVRRQAFYSLPSSHWSLLSRPPFSVLDHLSHLDDLIDQHAELAEAIFRVGFAFLAPKLDSEWIGEVLGGDARVVVGDELKVYEKIMDRLGVKASKNDVDKARSCIHQFYREWSAEGAVERQKCFDPVIRALEEEFASRARCSPNLNLDRSEMSVLAPGAGLGRLVFDICRAGFTVEGNEISYHELMASSLVLNHTKTAGQYTIAPFALNGSNHLTREDQFRTYQVPDIHPATELASHTLNSRVPAEERMSMATGDFCVLYSQEDSKETFDAVTTVFFIDTAPNMIRYIEAVRNCLKPGGLWINLGPLLWHHAAKPPPSEEDKNKDKEDRTTDANERDIGIADPGSVELTNEEVVALVQHLGFAMEKHETGTFETGYISDPSSMLQSTYRPSFWIARKK